MTRKHFCLAAGALMLASALPSVAQEKAPATGTLKVKLHYTGSGTVDEKHKILVFLFDSPEFTQGSVMPFAMKAGQSKDDTVTFTDVEKSPVYVATVYDPSGQYEGMSPPPSGSSVGMYGTPPDKPDPVKVEPGKTTEIDLRFDDTGKMP